jgi:hypothetical protein
MAVASAAPEQRARLRRNVAMRGGRRGGASRRADQKVGFISKILVGVFVMDLCNPNEYALLILAAAKPLTRLSEFHQAIADRLVAKGFLRLMNGEWYPTRAGLEAIRATVH